MASPVMPMPNRTAGDRPPEYAVSVRGLRKSYGDKTVLDGIDLRIPAGTVFALLGPNGAGKTTTVQILSTLVTADGGQAQVAGHDLTASPHGVRAGIGVTGQFAALDDLLTARENLLLMADLLRLGKAEGRARAGELLARFGIADVADTRAATFSGGMRRRLDLAMTLVGDPKVIFLDEPTTGLDPRSRRTMWETVRSLVAGGVTVFLTTQYLEEADQLADRVAVLDRGRIVAEGTADELKARIPGSHVRLRFRMPTSTNGRPRRSPGRPVTKRHWSCASRARAASKPCAPSSTGSTRPAYAPRTCPCTPPTSTTSFSP